MLDYHRSLLEDETRVGVLRQAIRRVVRPGDVVVDLGSGTGLLAFLACEAGARRVYAIEREHMADVIALLSRHLHLADRVTVLHQDSSSVDLPERADTLIAELVGASGLDENIVGLTIEARARFLREGATILPGRIALIAAPVEAHEAYARHVAFWNRPQAGFDFSPLRVFASNSMMLLRIAEEMHAAEPAEILEVDLATVTSTVVRGTTAYLATRDAVIDGFALWFRATLAEDCVLTNRSGSTTSWIQAFLPLEQPAPARRGARIILELETDDGKSWRWRGEVDGLPFDQLTALNRPPCFKP